MPDDIEITPAQAAARKWLLGFYSIDECLIDAEHKRTLAEAFEEFGLAAVAAKRERIALHIAALRRHFDSLLTNGSGKDHELFTSGSIHAVGVLQEILNATPPADRPLTADDVKAFFPNHKEFGMGRGNGTQIQVTHGEVMFSFLVDTEGAVWFLPFKIGTRSRFAQLVAAFGIGGGA